MAPINPMLNHTIRLVNVYMTR